jgi:site-specific DNA recombinase
VITRARNRYGSIYPYFVCVGRHQKRTTCTQKAMLISVVEELIEEFYAEVRLEPELREHIQETLSAELAASQQQAESEQRDRTTQSSG